MQYSPPKSLARSIFFWSYSSKQESFHLSARKLYDKCYASISVEINCFEYLQKGSYEKLNSGNLQVATIMALWKTITVFRSSSWNFLSPHYVTYFVRQRLQKFMEKVSSKVPFREISWENIHFCGLTKETFISNGTKI